MLHADLKTIHNWVRGGHILATRTEGRHMRFQRAEVVRFLRKFGYPIPAALGAALPRVLVHRASGPRAPAISGAVRTQRDGLFATVLEAAGGSHEVLVLDLDGIDGKSAAAFVAALRSRPETRCLYVIGLSNDASRRQSFVRNGGDAAVARRDGKAVGRTAKWIMGSVGEPPKGVVTRKDYP
jgi:excisionase family DNA binding protein